MPFVIGEYEKQLAGMGIAVATHPGKSWKCWICEKGLLRLTRLVDVKGDAGEARFICEACGDSVGIYPDKGGAVQPALKGMKSDNGSTFEFRGTNDPNTGGWR